MLSIALSVVVSLVVIWVVLVIALVVMKPDSSTRGEAARIVPDTVRLVRRLAADKTLHRGVRMRLWLLLGYLVSPIDLVPDFIPFIGFADDALVVSLVLRSVIKRAGVEEVRSHWPGTPDGLATLFRVCRLPQIATATAGALTEDRPMRESTPLTVESRSRLLRTGYVLEGITLGWNVIGVAVLAVAAIAARSVALGGFGLDSLIEIGASTVVLWELSGVGEERRRKALRAIGTAFVLLGVYLAVQSTYVLVAGYRPQPSRLGVVWTAMTAVVMFGLAAGKARVGRALDNPVLRTEGRVTLVDAFLASAVVVGLTLNAKLGWWWADPLAGYVILLYALKEGRAVLRSG